MVNKCFKLDEQDISVWCPQDTRIRIVSSILTAIDIPGSEITCTDPSDQFCYLQLEGEDLRGLRHLCDNHNQCTVGKKMKQRTAKIWGFSGNLYTGFQSITYSCEGGKCITNI